MNQQQMQNLLNLRRKIWTICGSRSVSFLWIKKNTANLQPSRSRDSLQRLSAEQRRELVEAKAKELKYMCQVLCGRFGIASRNVTPSALMKMSWVVTFKDDVNSKERLILQSLYGPKTWQDHNALSNRIPSISSDFPDTCCVTWFSNSQKKT